MTSQNLPRQVSVRKACAAGAIISGQLQAGNVPRLATAVLECGDSLAVELVFSFAESGKKTVAIKVDGEASMQCQRCLQPVDVAINTQSTLTVVAHDEEAKSTLRDIEPLLLAGDELDVYELVEEEVLLSLPIVALHSAEPCRVSGAGSISSSDDSRESEQSSQGEQRDAQQRSADEAGHTGIDQDGNRKPNPFASLQQLKPGAASADCSD
ncbi:MAG: DUF177 domain-containing protein [Gammaproteobacteria bacterium]|nr:DUF177 domain-containing protein [Gammaproteobacteria bacterium]